MIDEQWVRNGLLCGIKNIRHIFYCEDSEMMLKIEHISKFYGKQCALDDFNTVLSEGIYGL